MQELSALLNSLNPWSSPQVRAFKPDPVIQLLLGRLISASSSQRGDQATPVPSAFPSILVDSSTEKQMCWNLPGCLVYCSRRVGHCGKDSVLFPVRRVLTVSVSALPSLSDLADVLLEPVPVLDRARLIPEPPSCHSGVDLKVCFRSLWC